MEVTNSYTNSLQIILSEIVCANCTTIASHVCRTILNRYLSLKVVFLFHNALVITVCIVKVRDLVFVYIFNCDVLN